MSPWSPPTTPGVLHRLGAFCARRRRWVLGTWLLALVAAFVILAPRAGEPTVAFDTPGSDSAHAAELIREHFGDRSAEAVDIVWASDAGAEAPAVSAALAPLIAEAATLEGFSSVVSPELSADGRTAVARLQLAAPSMDDVPLASAERLLELAEDAEAAAPGLTVALGGEVILVAEEGEPNPEAIGLLVALGVLILTFGSLVAAGLPILSALMAMGVVTGLIGMLALVMDTPDFAAPVAIIVGLGVGIDYALLMVNRFRNERTEGRAVPEAVAATTATAGRSVLVAALTVVISMLGLTTLGLQFMTAMALAAAAAVLLAGAAALTLIPALLALLGPRVDRLRVPGLRPSGAASPRWAAWSRAVQRRPSAALAAGIALLMLLAAPVVSLRLGMPDAGNDPAGTSTRTAYDLVSEGFGPGGNGPLLVVAETPAGTPPGAGERLRSALAEAPGVASVSPPVASPDEGALLLALTPQTAPQDAATADLVALLRERTAPAVRAETGLSIAVGGLAAATADSGTYLGQRLPLLIGLVIGLAVLLLVAAFRSVAIAVKAALMNVLSIGAAYGVVALVAQGGWLGRLVGVDTEVPVPPFVPVMMFAILFGLSMDYEVFLLSRIRERYLAHGDTTRAVTEGLAGTATVITAAAAIMVAVFVAFALGAAVFLKLFAIGMAAAIVIDATIVRMLLVPAAMQALGRANWWMPAWLDRALPGVRLEGVR